MAERLDPSQIPGVNVRDGSAEQAEYKRRLDAWLDDAEKSLDLISEDRFWPDVEPGSRMASDDARGAGVSLSTTILTLLNVAIEHQHALSGLVRHVNWLHNSVPWTLSRSSVELAAIALWLQIPTDPKVRLGRLITYQLQDNHDHEKTWTLWREDAGVTITRDEVFERRRAWAETVRQSEALGKLPPFKMIEILQEIDQAKAAGKHEFELFWRMASGFAHGRQWAQLNLLTRITMPDGHPGKIRVSGGVDLLPIVRGAGTAYELILMARNYYRLSCLAQPPEESRGVLGY